MIRLSANENDNVDWRQVAARLRGAAIDPQGASLAANCDAVLLLAPTSNVAETGTNLLAAGKHVLQAADLCTSNEMLMQLSEAAQSSGAQFWCVNPDRFVPSRQLIREQLDKGHLGEVGLVRSHRWTERPSPGAESADALPPMLTRDLDLVLWYANHSPNRAYAVSRPVEASGSRGSIVNIHLGFEGGGMALLDYARRMPQGGGYQSLSVIGATGAAYADDHQNMQLAYDSISATPRAIQTSEGIRPLVALVQAFVDGLAAKRDMSASVAEWRAVLKVKAALEKSLASGQAVSLEGSEHA